MFVRKSVAVSNPRAAIDALISREGASFFRDIKEYSSYEKNGRFVLVKYPTTLGEVSMTLDPLEFQVHFSGKAPMGVTFEGCWKHVGTRMILEQHINGVPWFFRTFVDRRTNRALEDLEKL